MKIKFYGHASFLIEDSKGVKIITDPYEPGSYGSLNYKPIDEPADIVTVSHDHADHNHVASVRGTPTVIKTPGMHEVKGISIKGVKVYHDKSSGRERGENIIFIMEVDGFRIAHLGDLGHTLTEADAQQLGPIDILLIPVGGFYTIDSSEAHEVLKTLNPKLVIPMHFKTPAVDFPIAPVDDFIKGQPNVKRLGTSEVEISHLPATTEIWVLDPAKL